MGRFINHRDMTDDEISSCSREALAIIDLCEAAAWTIQNGGDAMELSDCIGSGLKTAKALLEPVQEALESHEGGH